MQLWKFDVAFFFFFSSALSLKYLSLCAWSSTSLSGLYNNGTVHKLLYYLLTLTRAWAANQFVVARAAGTLAGIYYMCFLVMLFANCICEEEKTVLGFYLHMTYAHKEDLQAQLLACSQSEGSLSHFTRATTCLGEGQLPCLGNSSFANQF